MNWKEDWKRLAGIVVLFLGLFSLPVGILRFDKEVFQGLFLSRSYAREHVALSTFTMIR